MVKKVYVDYYYDYLVHAFKALDEKQRQFGSSPPQLYPQVNKIKLEASQKSSDLEKSVEDSEDSKL